MNAPRVGKPDQGHSRKNGVCAAGELLEHVSRILSGTGLAENFAVQDNDRIGSEDDCRTHSASGDKVRFGIGQPLDERRRRLARIMRFIHRGRKHGKRQSGVGKNFSAARGRRSQNEFHGDPGKNTTRESLA